jgi:iron complex outermembrane receptor protein
MRDVLNGWCRVLTLGLCVFGAAGSVRLQAQAETNATLTGTVLDPEGGAVPNVAVVVRNDATGLVRTVFTNASGRFSADALPAGVYVVEVTAPGFATARLTRVQLTAGKPEDVSITLSVAGLSERVNVSAALPAVEKNAPAETPLTAQSAESVISGEFIRNFTSPVADFAEVVQMVPGAFSLNPNGIGLGQGKTYFRGFADGQYTMTFDGIPFEDTNSPTHHSWAFFPSQQIGGTVFDRSPGSAATLGPSNFGGSINLLSRDLKADPQFNGTASYGSFNTRLFDAEYATGRFGPNGSSTLLLEAQDMRSDGYETLNSQERQAVSGKYQYALSDNTALTVFGSYVDLHANTPNNPPTRAQVTQFGNNYLLSSDPTQPNYTGYNFYHVPTDFEYVGLQSNLGHGWMVDDKVYSYYYWNRQNYNSATAISATSAVDKLNGYRRFGNILPVTQTSQWGVFRTGLWSEYGWTDRYQIPSNPLTWVDAALPNFHEKFGGAILAPYAEYEVKVSQTLRITPGIKLDYYTEHFTQFADNGKVVGNLNGAASVAHTAAYHAWLPSLNAHYMPQSNWSMYGQYAQGDYIPPTSVFDVKNAAVLTLPNPTKATTYQVGSVWKSARFTLDLDVYNIHFENGYSSTTDPVTGEAVYFLAGTSVTKGVEAEGNILLARGLSLYLSGTAGTAKYSSTGLWVANAPSDTEGLGVSESLGSWDVGFFGKRIGKMYNDNGGTNQAIAIDPFPITNLYVNYTLRNQSRFEATKIRLSVNNLSNNQNIVGVTPASTKTSAPAPGDQLTLLPGRSVSLTFTIGVSPKHP